MTPQEIRNKRLANDYREMVNIKGNIIQWKPLKGIVPYIEEYELTIKIRSIIDATPIYRDSHVVRVTIPANYPNSAPEIRMITTPFVYHPNWWRDGKWCFGTWIISESLGNYILRMIKTLQYDAEITNENSPTDHSIRDWYVSKKHSGIFPCDKTLLPDPTKSKISIVETPKKKFDIH